MHTDPTQITTTPTETHTPISAAPSESARVLPRTEGGERIVLVMCGVVAAALLLIGGFVLAAGGGSSGSAGGDTAAGQDGVLAATTDEDVVDDETLDASPSTTVDEPEPEPEPVPEPEPEPEPAPEPEPGPADPCDTLAPGQSLAVSEGPLELPVGTFAGEILITNCSDVTTGWSASTLAPGVQLGVDQGLLAPGATTDVAFAVAPGQIVGTSQFFTIQISEPDFDTGVMVKVTKIVLDPGVLIDSGVLIEP